MSVDLALGRRIGKAERNFLGLMLHVADSSVSISIVNVWLRMFKVQLLKIASSILRAVVCPLKVSLMLVKLKLLPVQEFFCTCPTLETSSNT
jgi:hypothetical protein